MRHPVPFDARALTEPADRTTVRHFVKERKAQGQAPSSLSAKAAIALIIGIVVLFLFGSVFLTLLGGFLSASMHAPSAAPLFVILLLVVLGAVAGVAGYFAVARHNERWYRLHHFAAANAMTYVPRVQAPGLPGMIFTQGHDRQARDLVRGFSPRFVEFANYRYSTGSGKNETTHRWGYVAVKLDVPLPHIVLDALSNNGLFGSSNLPLAFTKDQRLSLEGDFDKHFALYCPAGYEQDALYLFTPDIMARLIDTAAALDVEIVDDWLFLYARRDFTTLDPATWAWLFSVVGALLTKLGQWSRWRDERLRLEHAPQQADAAGTALPFAVPTATLTPPPGVAPPGRRLRRGRTWVFVLPIAFAIIWFAAQFVLR